MDKKEVKEALNALPSGNSRKAIELAVQLIDQGDTDAAKKALAIGTNSRKMTKWPVVHTRYYMDNGDFDYVSQRIQKQEAAGPTPSLSARSLVPPLSAKTHEEACKRWPLVQSVYSDGVVHAFGLLDWIEAWKDLIISEWDQGAADSKRVGRLELGRFEITGEEAFFFGTYEVDAKTRTEAAELVQKHVFDDGGMDGFFEFLDEGEERYHGRELRRRKRRPDLQKLAEDSLDPDFDEERD
jgi:hypothetical protein